MNVVRDILDKQLLDRNGRNMGKADGLVLELRANAPPRLALVEIGPVTLTRRFSPKLAVRIHRWLSSISLPGCSRMAWEKVRDVGVDIELDVEAEETGAMKVEKELREKIICRIPGA